MVGTSPLSRQQRERATRDATRIPTRDISFIIKTMKALRQPSAILDTNNNAGKRSAAADGSVAAGGVMATLAHQSDASNPNWRALVYNDVYREEEEQKEAIRKRYEPLLQAQAKLKQQQQQQKEQQQQQSGSSTARGRLFGTSGAGGGLKSRGNSPSATGFGTSLKTNPRSVGNGNITPRHAGTIGGGGIPRPAPPQSARAASSHGAAGGAGRRL